MRQLALASALVLVAGSPALAQGVQTLEEALSRFPLETLTFPEPIQVSFVDMQAVSAIGAVSGSAHGLPGQRLGFGMVDALTPIMQGGPDAWAENAGIALDAVRYFAGSGSAPVFMNVWGLADEAAVASLIEGLDRHGFEPWDDERILGNGEPLAIDPSSRGIANPWRDQLGRAAFVAPAETTLIHATTPQAAAYLLDGDERLTDHPMVATALAGLDAGAAGGEVVQAMLISPVFGMQGGDIEALLMESGGDMDRIRKEIEARMESFGEGIPPYFGGLLADVQAERPALVVSLAYADCDTAETAAGLIATRWDQTMAEMAPGLTESQAVAGAEGLCSAVVTVTSESDDASVNPVARALFSAFMQRQFTVLNIGETAQ